MVMMLLLMMMVGDGWKLPIEVDHRAPACDVRAVETSGDCKRCAGTQRLPCRWHTPDTTRGESQCVSAGSTQKALARSLGGYVDLRAGPVPFNVLAKRALLQLDFPFRP